jgi:hypothetical protein
MSSRFSAFSKANLATCDTDLQRLFQEVIRHIDCRVIEGHRGAERQRRLFETGKSKLLWPHSEHNMRPARAVDVIPYPVDWRDRERMTYFAGIVRGIGSQLGIATRWGGDWDGDTRLSDNAFDDLAHFELI